MNQKKLIKQIQKTHVAVNSITLKLQEFAMGLSPTKSRTKIRAYIATAFLFIPWLLAIPLYMNLGFWKGSLAVILLMLIASYIEKKYI